MASLFIALSRDSERYAPSAAEIAAVRRAMRERCPGPIEECGSGPLLCLFGGADGGMAVEGSTLVATDGLVLVPGGTAGDTPSSSASALAAVWRTSGAAVLPRLDGGFALCAYDGSTRQVTLASDRFGSRPLFWADRGDILLAASESKILAALGIPLRIEREVLDEVLLFRWMLGERHLLAPIRRVPAASCVTLNANGRPESRRYWRLQFAPREGSRDALEHYRDETRRAMGSAVAAIAAGRGTVGVLLSGGVDSSVIAGAARETVGRCVGFAARIPDFPNPELERALVVARHLGIECRVVDIEPPRLGDDLRALVRRLEEPPRHPNNLVLQQLFRRAAGEVDLVLQGDGAEMLFGLADVRRVARFRRKRIWVAGLPAAVRRVLAARLRGIDDARAERLARILAWDTVSYAALLDAVGYSAPVQRALRGPTERGAPRFLPLEHFASHDDFGDALQAYQADTFLSVSLVRHDRLAQPLALASESPFLRAPVVDVAGALPRGIRYRDGPKPVLRALCDLYLPPEVSRWPKLGFPVPWEEWVLRAYPGGAVASSRAAVLLPPGFLAGAVAARDAEALWTAWTLSLLVEEFGVEVR